MYNEFFGLKENPFSISPDPQYFYMSKGHIEAFRHLLKGITEGGSFVILTGEVGTGKTTVSRRLMHVLAPDTDFVMIYNTRLEPQQLLAEICGGFHIKTGPSASIKELFDLIKVHLEENFRTGKKSIVMFDEAQLLPFESLEQLRLLTNLETDSAKYLQVVLIGQPELQQRLESNELRQLAQRVTARYHLMPLTRNDVDAYLRYRMQVAGVIQPVFAQSAVKRIYRETGGVPRLINLLADRSLTVAAELRRPWVTRGIVAMASREILGLDSRRVKGLFKAMALAVSCAGLALGIALFSPAEAHYGWFKRPVIKTVLTEKVTDEKAKQKIEDDRKLFAQDTRQAVSELSSINDLYRVWGYSSGGQSLTCADASYAGLACAYMSGSLRDMVRLQHPVSARLYDPKLRSEFYATVSSVSPGGKAELIVNGDRFEVAMQYLEKVWSGEYTLLYRSVPGSEGQESVSPSDCKQECVVWLRKSLSRALNIAEFKDKKLSQRVSELIRSFQQTRDLPADGKIGLMTILLLNAAGGANMPHLTESANGL